MSIPTGHEYSKNLSTLLDAKLNCPTRPNMINDYYLHTTRYNYRYNKI